MRPDIPPAQLAQIDQMSAWAEEEASRMVAYYAAGLVAMHQGVEASRVAALTAHASRLAQLDHRQLLVLVAEFAKIGAEQLIHFAGGMDKLLEHMESGTPVPCPACHTVHNGPTGPFDTKENTDG